MQLTQLTRAGFQELLTEVCEALQLVWKALSLALFDLRDSASELLQLFGEIFEADLDVDAVDFTDASATVDVFQEGEALRVQRDS